MAPILGLFTRMMDMTDANPSYKSGPPMKPATAAKKLGIYLPATPQEFQDSALTLSLIHI